MSSLARSAARPQPGSRREQLAGIAAELFAARGYHNVSVNDIAAVAGLSGPAIYRHFPSKQAILQYVLRSGLELLLRVVDGRLESDAPTMPEERLRGVFEELASHLISHPEISALWRRERRHLTGPQRAAMAHIMTRTSDLIVSELRRMIPSLTTSEAELRTWAGASVLGSVSDHRVRLPRVALQRLLVGIVMDVLTAGQRDPGVGEQGTPPQLELSLLDARREQLLGVAAHLFRERGYHEVTMEDIGTAAGIAGPSVYSHFDSKSDLLESIADRIGERLRYTTAQARNADRPPRQTVDLLVDHYVDTVVEYHDFVAAYFSEGNNLPQRAAVESRRFQRAYTAHWAELLIEIAPELSKEQSHIRVHAAFAVVNDIALTRRFARRPIHSAALRTLMPAALGITAHPTGRPPTSAG